MKRADRFQARRTRRECHGMSFADLSFSTDCSNSLAAMRTRSWIAVLLIGAVVAVFVSPGAASGKGGHVGIEAAESVEFRLKGSHGYSISVSGASGAVSLT